MGNVVSKNEVETWKNTLIVVNVKRDHTNDERISDCDTYQKVITKNNDFAYFHRGMVKSENIIKAIDQNTFIVKTGALTLFKTIKEGEIIEIEMRVRCNKGPYPLSKMGRK